MSGTNSTADFILPSGFYIGIILFNFLCIIVGILGNVGVIAYNIFMNNCKTPTTYFVVNLAISDIVVCLTFFPPWLVKYISILEGVDSNFKLICKIGMTSSSASIALSVANLLAITADRCMFITKPLKYPKIMTWKRTHILLFVIWILAIANASFVFFNTDEIPELNSCRIKNPQQHVFGLINIFLPTAGLLYFNYKIYRVAKNQNVRIKSERRTHSKK